MFHQEPKISSLKLLIILTGFETMPIFKDLTLITAVERLNKEDSSLYLLVLG
jgi:hypothetical protein